MPTEVKICGLSDEAGVDAALEAGADFVGFVFFPPSPRSVSPARAAALARRAWGKAGVVALTVDAEDALLATIAEALRPDLLQLHGRESAARLNAVAALTRRPLMKALGIAAAADLAAANGYPGAERLLLDAKPPREASRPGGNGAPFDWSLITTFTPGKPWFLSGGLGLGNVAHALAATGAPAVDVSSGVESAPGRKAPGLIRAFVTAVRAFDAAQVSQRLRVSV